MEGSAVPCGGGQVDAGVAGPVAYRFAERLELVGVFVAAADVGELFDDVTELLDVDGVAASPATPQVERFDLSSQAIDVVDGVVELLAHVVAMQRRGGLVDACSCLVVVLDVCGGVSSGAFEVFGRCFELRGSGVMVAAGVASAADAAVVEVVLGAGVAPPRLLVEVRRRRQRSGEPEPSPPRSGRGRVGRRWPRLQVEPASPRSP